MLRTERMASIGRLAAGTAHEINNPLTYVIGNLEHIEDELRGGAPTPQEIAAIGRALGDALEGARRIQRIVRDMRTYGRIDEEGGSAEIGSVLDSALRIAASELQHRARLVREHEELPTVVGDSGRLVQVFLNLLLNAVQALPDDRKDQNEIRIRVTQDGESVAVAVSDNGRGIAPEDLPRVTEPFFTTKPVGEGTGLGLSVSRNIVERFGGAIAIESTLGEGTTVRVRLIRAKEAAEGADLTAERGRDRELACAPDGDVADRRRVAKIMLIDDDRLVVRAMKRLLHEHEITTVETGVDALALLRGDAEFDVVLCDLMMPGMSGMEVYERVLEERAELAPRIVFMSGGAFTARSQEFLETVDNRFVEKPIDVHVLEDIVRQALESATRDRHSAG
jgi:CheY-like chemotaxis protein